MEIPEPADLPVSGPTADDLDKAERIELVEVMRIDGNAANTLFSSITDLAVSERSETYVVDYRADRIRVFNAQGQPIDTIGGTGAGPGDLTRPSHLALGGDTLFVIDRRGINRFHSNGAFIDRTHIANPPGTPNRASLQLYPQSLDYTDRGLVTSFKHSTMRANPASMTRDTTSLHVLGVLTGIPGEAVAYAITFDQFEFGPLGRGTPLFLPPPSYAVSATGVVYVTHMDTKDIDVHTLSGVSRRRIRIAATRRRVTNADLDGLLEAAKRSTSSSPMSPVSRVELIRSLARLPHSRYWPVLGRLLTTPDGRLLLVERPDLEADSPGSRRSPTTWDLLRDDGSIAGRMTFAPSVRPMVVRPRQ